MFKQIILSVIKSALTLFLLSAVIIPVNSLQSGTPGDINITVLLPTIQCNMCAANISEALDKVKGVKDYSVNLEEKNATVTYDDALTTLEKIENAISKAGYVANNKKANKKAYNKLNKCCKLPEDR